MTATKNNSIFKKLGALAMAMCLTCALAVSASAVDVGNYTATLSVASETQHDLDFFAGPAVVTEVGDTSVMTVELKDPASVTVHPDGMPFPVTATGSISGAVLSESYSGDVNYSVVLNRQDTDGDGTMDYSTLTVTCPSDVDVLDFAPLITFTIDITSGPTTSHRPVDATLTLD